MTPAQFTMWAEATFGRYLPAMKQEVEKWLSTRSQYFRAAMREVALREHPSVYGKPPGVHELEVWKKEAYEKGHTLEALSAPARPLIAEVVEPITEEEAMENVRRLRKMMGGGR